MGSLNYIAPEILEGSGHSFEVDLFSIGVMFFELICGSLPYGDDENDPVKVYQAIMSLRVQFPNWIKNKPMKLLIRRLCRRNPSKRKLLTFESIKANETFKGLNWNKIEQKGYFAKHNPKLFRGHISKKKIIQMKKTAISFEEHFNQPNELLEI